MVTAQRPTAVSSGETAKFLGCPRAGAKYAVEAIGFTVAAGALAVGAISGGAFNPAVSLGTAAMGMFAWPTLWIYLVAQVLAGIAAGATFLALNPDDA